jgi:metal-sulfur cluster biosynthetic enzyme
MNESAGGRPLITEEKVFEALRPVSDPEIGLSILDLGLVYGVAVNQDEGAVTVTMTLTSQMCPAGPEILGATEMAARRVPGVEKAVVELVWEPVWDPKKHCSDDAKAFLGIWD